MTVIVCPQCSRKHNVNLEQLPNGKSVVARCKACNHKFQIQLDKLKAQAPIESDGKKKGAQARKICITLSKGGVGKTTTSVNLSAGLALAGFKVLLIDTDTQGQAAYLLGKKPEAGLTELLTKELAPEEAVFQARKNLWLLSGGKSLAGVKRIIDRKNFGAEYTLTESLKMIEDQYDYIIIDTSPGWDQLTVNVLFYATEVLIPVALEVMPLQGLSEFMKSLGAIQKYRKDINLKYVLPTFMDTRVSSPKKIFSVPGIYLQTHPI